MKRKFILALIFISVIIITTANKNAEKFQQRIAIAPFKTIKIGKQTWTAENLDLRMPKSWYYNNDSIYKKYGRLYYWSNAMAAVPKGWHVPSLNEWKELIAYCGGDSVAGGKLMEGGSTGLNLQLGGHLSANITTDLLFDMLNFKGFYWTSTTNGVQEAFAVVVTKGTWFVEKNFYRRANGFSVRLIKDEKNDLKIN